MDGAVVFIAEDGDLLGVLKTNVSCFLGVTASTGLECPLLVLVVLVAVLVLVVIVVVGGVVVLVLSVLSEGGVSLIGEVGFVVEVVFTSSGIDGRVRFLNGLLDGVVDPGSTGFSGEFDTIGM